MIDANEDAVRAELESLLGEPDEIHFKNNYVAANKYVDARGVNIIAATWAPVWDITLGNVTYDEKHTDGVIYLGSDVVTMKVERGNELALSVAAVAIHEWLVERSVSEPRATAMFKEDLDRSGISALGDPWAD
jgi:hypothetical protein